MKAYALDWRQRILDAYLKREGSIRDLARRFNVSCRLVGGVINRFRHTGSCAPKPRGGHNPPRMPATAYDTLRRLVATPAAATRAELCEVFAHETPIRLRISSMQRPFAKLHLTRKKRPFRPQHTRAPRFNRHVKRTGKPSRLALPAS